MDVIIYSPGLGTVHLRYWDCVFQSRSRRGCVLVHLLCLFCAAATGSRPKRGWSAWRGRTRANQKNFSPNFNPTAYIGCFCIPVDAWGIPFPLPQHATSSTKNVTKSENWRLWPALNRGGVRIILQWTCALTGVYFIVSLVARILLVGELLSRGT